MEKKAVIERTPAVRELRESVLLLVLAAASVGTYIAVGIVAVRLFAR
jgi:hypothetical protein